MLVRWWGRQAFLALALVPAAAFGWVLAQLATVTGGGEVRRDRRRGSRRSTWTISLRLDALSLTFALLVTGVGALVLRLLRPVLRARATTASAGSPAT